MIHRYYAVGAVACAGKRSLSSTPGALPGKYGISWSSANVRGDCEASVNVADEREGYAFVLFKGVRAGANDYVCAPPRWSRNKRPFFVDLCMAADQLEELA